MQSFAATNPTKSLFTGLFEYYRSYPAAMHPADLRVYYKTQNQNFPSFFATFTGTVLMVQLFVDLMLLIERHDFEYIIRIVIRQSFTDLIILLIYLYMRRITGSASGADSCVTARKKRKDVSEQTRVRTKLMACGLLPTLLFALPPISLINSPHKEEICALAWIMYYVLQFHLSANMVGGTMYKIMLMLVFNTSYCCLAIWVGCFRYLVAVRLLQPVMLFAIYILVLDKCTAENFVLRRAYKRQKDLFQNFMEQIQDSVLILDSSRLIFHNRAARSVLGINGENYYARLRCLVSSRKSTLEDYVRAKFASGAALSRSRNIHQEKYFWEDSDEQSGEQAERNRIRRVVQATVIDSAMELGADTISAQTKVVSILVRDMTDELRRGEKKAEEKYKNMLLFSLSHELKTPLNIFQGFLSDSKALIHTEHMRGSFLQAKGAWRYLRNKINDILDYAHLISGEFALHKSKFSLERLVGYLRKTTSFLLTSKAASAVSLDFRVDPRIPDSCFADRDRLEQVLFNFLSNAAKFTEKGLISLLVAPCADNSRIVFSVADTGCGMSRETVNSLFALAQETSSGSQLRLRSDQPKKASQLSGLGLTVSNMICVHMGSEIAVSSLLGKGSTFRFSVESGLVPMVTLARSGGATHLPSEEAIPCEEAVSGDKTAILARVLGAKNSLQGVIRRHINTANCGYGPWHSKEPAKKLALVVDDNDFNRDVAERMLKKRGFATTTAGDGRTAIEVLRKLQTEHQTSTVLVFMDVDMPVMDGIETTITIRRESRRPRPIIVALTAFSAESERQKCIEAGMDGFIDKPLTKERLCELICNFGMQ